MELKLHFLELVTLHEYCNHEQMEHEAVAMKIQCRRGKGL